jgi:hypothetical protein
VVRTTREERRALERLATMERPDGRARRDWGVGLDDGASSVVDVVDRQVEMMWGERREEVR